MGRNKLEFQQLLEIVDNVDHNQIFDFSYFDPEEPFTVEYIEFPFDNARMLLEWITTNRQSIQRTKVLLDIDYLLNEQYWQTRIKERGFNRIYLHFRKKSAYVSYVPSSDGITISCETFEIYQKQLVQAVLSN